MARRQTDTPKNKLLARLTEASARTLSEHRESGMGYYILQARFDDADEARTVIVAGRYLVVPVQHPTYVSLEDLRAGTPLPETPDVDVQIQFTASNVSLDTVTLPSWYVPAPGAVPLIGSTTLNGRRRFYRLTGTPTDPQYVGGALRVGAYLSPSRDRPYANTGFAAVGRYALPIPAPASFMFADDLPSGATIQVGTVAPQFGQAGGGVEVKLISTPLPISQRPIARPQLNDF